MNGMNLPLTACRKGDTGTVFDVSGSCETSKRLAELGVHEGSVVHVKRAGMPMIVQVGETRICLRAEMADSILVTLSDNPVVDWAQAETTTV